MARKFVSLKTLEIAAAVVAEKIAASQPGEQLRALYRADTELAEAIAAAEAEPTEPAAPRKNRKRGNRRSAGPVAVEPQQSEA